MKNIVIFASGGGTNADNLMHYFKDHNTIQVVAVFTNKREAGVLQVAKKHGIPAFHFNRELFEDSEFLLQNLKEQKTDLIVLAGFLWKIPIYLIEAYQSRIINLHPALLPKYGGKGMYGSNVHEAVIANGDDESGITIHYVNEYYDEGEVILQEKCEVMPTDTVEDLAQRIHQLEYEFLPKVAEQILKE